MAKNLKPFRDDSVYNRTEFDTQQNIGITKKISAFYSSVLEAESLEGIEQPPRLRPSALPVCSFTALGKIIDYNEEGKEKRRYMSDFFMRVGTEVHSVLDKWCAQSDVKVWGDWKCSNNECRCKWGLNYGANGCPDDSICSYCGSKGIYEEIELEYRGMKGHIDCILITNKGVIVVDFKTASSYKVHQQRYSHMGSPQYPLQLFAYTYMLDRVYGEYFKRKYNKSVIGCGLLFVSRDNPSNHKIFSWGDIALTSGKSLLRAGTKRWSLAQKAYDNKKLSKSLLANRLCKDNKDYLDNKAAFFPYGGCPHYDKCVGKKDNFKSIRQHFNELLSE